MSPVDIVGKLDITKEMISSIRVLDYYIRAYICYKSMSQWLLFQSASGKEQVQGHANCKI